MAMTRFQQMFGHPSISTVAPCYLWNDDIESAWKEQGVQYIQTAGYRCTGRGDNGSYIQDPPLIRAGNQSKSGQIYLARNVMYEPVDGIHTPFSAFKEALQAYQQALPITISTHRYNYTRSQDEFDTSLSGLNSLLGRLISTLPVTRFLSSPELGDAIHQPKSAVKNHFNQDQWPAIAALYGTAKIAPFLQRLRYRHPKLVLLSLLTGLVIPAGLIILFDSRTSLAFSR